MKGFAIEEGEGMNIRNLVLLSWGSGGRGGGRRL
jgi:hypothetical protein